MRSMVEGLVRLFRTIDPLASCPCPSTSCAGLPPPVGENWQ